jgi:hypothetical protein
VSQLISSWLHKTPPLHEHDALLKQANELNGEAAIESGWDNFSTAERLRKQVPASKQPFRDHVISPRSSKPKRFVVWRCALPMPLLMF